MLFNIPLEWSAQANSPPTNYKAHFQIILKETKKSARFQFLLYKSAQLNTFVSKFDFLSKLYLVDNTV